MGAFDRTHRRGYEDGLARAVRLVIEEPELPGPMPWRNWLRAILRPERSARAACRATKASIVDRLRREILEESP